MHVYTIDHGSASSDMEAGMKTSGPEFLAGMAAALTETCVTYPAVKIVFRQQLQGILAKKALTDITSEGLYYLYRGVVPPLLQKTATRSIMFGMYDVYYQNFFADQGLGSTNGFTPGHAAAAFMAGSTEAVLCPFERTQTLLQSRQYHDRFRNTAHAVREIAKGPKGVLEYYRGLTAILIRNGPSTVAFLGLRGPLKDAMPQTVPYFNEFVSGAFLGASLSTVTYPLNVVKTRMQSTVFTEFNSFYRTFCIVWKERKRSVRLIFRGVHINFTRSFFSWGITNAAFEFFHGFFIRKSL